MTSTADAPLYIHSLEIRHFAGVRNETAFRLDNLSPGINLIYGPNGCGKSTTARAMQQILWPDVKSDYSDLYAHIRWQEHTWNLVSRGREVKALSGSESLPHPAWAAPDTRGRYHWSLQNLLQEQDGELARQIAREMAGGIDFQALATTLNWHKKPQAPQKLHQAYLAAERKLRETQAHQQALKLESLKLNDLRTSCEQAMAKADQAANIALAIEFNQKSQRKVKLDEILSTYPPHLDHLNGDDADKLEKLLQEHAELATAITDLKQQKLRLGAGEEAWGTVSEQDFQQARKALESVLDQIQENDRDCREAEAAFHAAETEQQTLHHSIGIHAKAALKLADGFSYPEIHTWIQLIFKQLSLTERIKVLEEAIPNTDAITLYDPDLIREARRNLEAWLNQQDSSKAISLAGFTLSTITLATLLVFLCLEKGFNWGWCALIAPPILLQYAAQKTRNQSTTDRLQAQHPETLPPPESWTLPHVKTYLQAMDQWLRDAHADRLTEVDRRRLKEAKDALAEIETEINTLDEHLKSTGLDLQPDPEWIAHFLQTVQTWRQIRNKTKVAEERWTALVEQKTKRETQLSNLIKNWGQREASLSLKIAVEEISARMQAETLRRQQQKELDLTLKHLQQQRSKNEAESAQLCQRVGLEKPDVTTLRQRVSQLPQWESDFRESETLSARLSELRKLLGEQLASLPTDLEGLESEASACDEARQEERRLREQISKLEQRIEDQRKGRGVHEASEALDACKEALLSTRESQLKTQMGMEILEWLQEQCRSRDRSKVLEEANRHLSLFSKGTLQLHLSKEGNGDEFTASAAGQPPQALDTLSSGERTQLLMAVRLAFLHLNEHAPLPLLVDEALGTTDDQRGEELIRALIEVSKQGRQIIYFTAQHDEVNKWRQVLAEEQIEGQFIDLEAIRSQQTAEALPELQTLQETATDYKQAEGENIHAWAQRLEVSAWQPQQAIEELHLWHLVHDHPPLLETLLSQGIKTVGSWITYAQADALSHWVSEIDIKNTQQSIDILRSFQSQWQIGRPPPVSMPEILLSGAVTDKFVEPISQLNEELSGDAQAIIQSLRDGKVKGFFKQKITDLESYLLSNGYLSESTPLNDDEIKARVMAAYADQAIPLKTWQTLSHFFFSCCPGFRLL